jgi:hypothetical protein
MIEVYYLAAESSVAASRIVCRRAEMLVFETKPSIAHVNRTARAETDETMA